MFIFINYFVGSRYPAAAFLLAGALFLTACGGGGGGGGGSGGGSPAVAVVVFVDPSATGAGDGSSWADAYTTVQGGVDAASPGDSVWVKQGAYRAAFATATVLVMKDGVAVYGGFTGTETDLAERSSDPALTILSGDQAANDPGTLTDNSYQVVLGASNATLDGFTVTAGNAVGAFPAFRGGGMYNDSVTNLEIVNVAFIGNTAGSGGGMRNILSSSSPALTNVTFIGNTASTSGGGMYNGSAADSSFSSSPTLTNVTFSGNIASSGGGGQGGDLQRRVERFSHSGAEQRGVLGQYRHGAGCGRSRWRHIGDCLLLRGAGFDGL